jgi:endonuclease YncB( thermonuclease family)
MRAKAVARTSVRAAFVFSVFLSSVLGPERLRSQTVGDGARNRSETCRLQPGGESAVLAVAGPQTLKLADGRFVRLAEVLVPSEPAGTAQGFDPASAAQTYLHAAAVGQKVEVRFGGSQRDRYGVAVGHVYVSGEPGVWLQEGLVRSGLALAYPQADNHACAQLLLSAEAAARQEKRGHWALSLFRVVRTTDAPALSNLAQKYQIVEGRVDHAQESGGRLTLYFSPQGRRGLVALVEPSAKRQLKRLPSADDWKGQELRLRGWVERRHDLTLAITQAEQIEFVSVPSKAPSTQTAR